MLISRTDRGLIANWWFTIDRSLFSAVFLLMAAGVLASMAASPPVALRLGLDYFHFFKYQLLYLIPAVVIFIGTSMVPPALIHRLCFLGFFIVLGLMVLALWFGPEIKGAHRWINVGPFSLQPSELIKPLFVVCVARLFHWTLREEHLSGLLGAWGLYSLTIGGLIIQPDFGQAFLISLVFLVLLFIYGISWRWIFGLGMGGVGLIALAFLSFSHVRSRIIRFINPDSGDNFQIETALKAISNGGVFGVGPGGGVDKTILPDAHTDFIAAVIVEEFGLLACFLLISLILFVILKGLRHAQQEPDPFFAFSKIGLVVIFGFQAMINLGVNAALLPAKGMTLPFISYGGSSLFATALGMGLLMALARKRPQGFVG